MNISTLIFGILLLIGCALKIFYNRQNSTENIIGIIGIFVGTGLLITAFYF